MKEIKEFENFSLLNEYLYSIFEKSITKNFNIIFTGGNTPIPFYKHIRNKKLNLSFGSIYLSDERLDVNFNETNEFTILNNLDSREINLIKYDNFGEILNPVSKYISNISHIKYFDFTLLGIGEDGHVASIFPNNLNFLNEKKSIITINNSPKLPKCRITMTASCLRKSKIIVYLINGNRKKDIFNNLFFKTNLIYDNILAMNKTYFLYTNEEI
jgi:6-phosphogluconolactonase